jgi:hypothetical protein
MMDIPVSFYASARDISQRDKKGLYPFFPEACYLVPVYVTGNTKEMT